MSILSESRTATPVLFITARNVAHRMVLILCATAMAHLPCKPSRIMAGPGRKRSSPS
jgi:hypothetical protein